MNFANAMYRMGSEKLTENGAFAYNSTAQGAMLDLFSQIGALRTRTEKEIANKFAAAFHEDKLLATKMLFYAGDIRECGRSRSGTYKRKQYYKMLFGRNKDFKRFYLEIC